MKRGSGIGGFLRNKENNKIKLSIKVDKVKKKNKQDKYNNAGSIDGYVKSKIKKSQNKKKRKNNEKIKKYKITKNKVKIDGLE